MLAASSYANDLVATRLLTHDSQARFHIVRIWVKWLNSLIPNSLRTLVICHSIWVGGLGFEPCLHSYLPLKMLKFSCVGPMVIYHMLHLKQDSDALCLIRKYDINWKHSFSIQVHLFQLFSVFVTALPTSFDQKIMGQVQRCLKNQCFIFHMILRVKFSELRALEFCVSVTLVYLSLIEL